MGAANHMRIGLASSPPCERFRPRYIPRGGNSAASNELALPAYGNHRSAPLIAFIAAAALVGFATNLSMHLLNLRMQTMGVSGIGIGLSVAVQALGIMIAAPLTKHVIAVIGVRYTLGLGALLASSTLCIFNFVSDPIAWNSVRLAFAIGLAVLFTASESLIISRADSSNRGRVVGWYATALATGTAAGPLLTTVIGIQGSVPLLWGSALFCLATTPIFAYLKPGEELRPVIRNSTLATIRYAPIAFLSAFVFGVADNGGMAMLSVYSVLSGYDYTNAVALAVFATVGAIALQLPLGYWAHNRDPRTMLLACGLGSIFLLTLLPNIINQKPIAFVTVFGLGGLLEGLYTVGLICIAKYYRGIGISSANGCFVSVCGFGELMGPLATGTSMEWLGSKGFVVCLTVMLALYVVLLVSFRNAPAVRPGFQASRPAKA